MNKNLHDVLEMMLFMSDEQVLWSEFDKINFKKKNWFHNYHWTEKQEERFGEWLSEHLKKNWEGISEHKPQSKKVRDITASMFIGNYGCVTRELTTGDFMPTVSWAHLDEVMSKREREAFNKWMFGQTTSLHGVYKDDLSRYLAGLPCID